MPRGPCWPTWLGAGAVAVDRSVSSRRAVGARARVADRVLGVVRLVERGVDRDGELDLLAQLGGQRLGHRVAHPLLDDVLGVVVGHLDQGGAVEQAGEAGQGEERALPGGEPVGVEGGDGVLPDLSEVQICVTHRSHIPFDGLGGRCPVAGSWCLGPTVPSTRYPQPVGMGMGRGVDANNGDGASRASRTRRKSGPERRNRSASDRRVGVQCAASAVLLATRSRACVCRGPRAGLTLSARARVPWSRPVGRFRMPVTSSDVRPPVPPARRGSPIAADRQPPSTQQATRA